jgi:hypothetical protein
MSSLRLALKLSMVDNPPKDEKELIWLSQSGRLGFQDPCGPNPSKFYLGVVLLKATELDGRGGGHCAQSSHGTCGTGLMMRVPSCGGLL